MADRFESRMALACKIEWEGGLMEALDYGVRTEAMPEGDEELTAAWADLEASYRATALLAAKVSGMLPEPGDEAAGS